MGVVTDKLVGYWNSKQGIKGSVWENIAPATKGKYNGTIFGSLLQSDGLYHDGIDDMVTLPVPTEIRVPTSFSWSMRTKNVNLSGSYINLMDSPNDMVYTSLFGGLYIYVYNSSTGASSSSSRLGSFNNTSEYFLTFTFDNTTKVGRFYINGVLVGSYTYPSTVNSFLPSGFAEFFISSREKPRGIIDNIMLYNKALTTQEVTQNYTNGSEIGLTPPVSSSPPIVLNTTITRQKLGSVSPKDKTTLKFKFDQDVTDWSVMVLGSDYSTGTMAGNGKNVSKDTEISIDISYNMLYQEGDNRINIYGKNKDGLWTPYE